MNTINNVENQDIESTSIDYSIEEEFKKAVFDGDSAAESHVSEWLDKNADEVVRNLTLSDS
jgi:hypothetical protein